MIRGRPATARGIERSEFGLSFECACRRLHRRTHGQTIDQPEAGLRRHLEGDGIVHAPDIGIDARGLSLLAEALELGGRGLAGGLAKRRQIDADEGQVEVDEAGEQRSLKIGPSGYGTVELAEALDIHADDRLRRIRWDADEADDYVLLQFARDCA